MLALLFSAVLTACGGGHDDGKGSDSGGGNPPATSPSPPAPPPPGPMSAGDAVRLADQATFGPTETLVASIKSKGAAAWIAEQFSLKTSRYTSGRGNGEFHQYVDRPDFCIAALEPNCFRDFISADPLYWDFYRNAVGQPDQLRQRVALALQQIFPIADVQGTYGIRNYYNDMLDGAFGNYRQMLKKITLSPLMGDFLNNVNNDSAAPNENYARELLQLFSIGTCELNLDGSLKGGKCQPTYNNETVRAYAFALTGWTYPAGGAVNNICRPQGANCRYYNGDMVPIDRYHDTQARTLLSSVSLPAGTKATSALEMVLDSLVAHPNMAPFVGRQLIQHLVTSNPSPGYVSRVASAFNSGKYGSFGNGQRGDLVATVAAVLLDAEARGDTVPAQGGKLREPVLMFTGVLRGLNGTTDGDAFNYQWGGLQQRVFNPPSIFSFYPPDYPVAGTSLVGPAFGIHNASTALARLNFLIWVIDWGGNGPHPSIPNSNGTNVDLTAFASSAADAGALVDRLSMMALGRLLPAGSRASVVKAVERWTQATDGDTWRLSRVKRAAYLVYASPSYQIQR